MKTGLTFDDVNPSFLKYSELKGLLGFLEKENIPATLFAIPYALTEGSEDYAELLQQAHQVGHEIALHGYGHKRNEFGYIAPIPLPGYEKQRALLAEGKMSLSKLLHEEPLGFRAPDYRHSAITLRALRDLGFRYDSSKTVFKPTHGLRFRLKTGVSPKASSLNGLIEIPVTADYTLSTASVSLDRRLRFALDDFEWAKKIGGAFVVNNHVDFAHGLVFEFLDSLIKEIENETEFVRLKDFIP